MWVRCVLFRTCCGIDSLHHTPSRHRPVPAPSAEAVLSPPPAGPFLYASYDTESPGYYLHYLINDSGSENYTSERGENNQPPLTGRVDLWWLQATFKKGYSALLCLWEWMSIHGGLKQEGSPPSDRLWWYSHEKALPPTLSIKEMIDFGSDSWLRPWTV